MGIEREKEGWGVGAKWVHIDESGSCPVWSG